MQQGAGEGGEVEDLLPLVEGVDLDGAEGEFAVPVLSSKGGDDLGEVVAAADEDGDRPGFGSCRRAAERARRQRLGDRLRRCCGCGVRRGAVW